MRRVLVSASARNDLTARDGSVDSSLSRRKSLDFSGVLRQLGDASIMDEPEAALDSAQKVVCIASSAQTLGVMMRCRHRAARASHMLDRSKSGWLLE